MMAFFEKDFYNEMIVESVPVAVELGETQNPLETVENYENAKLGDNICRACLGQDDDLQRLLDSQVENNLILTMFTSCTSLEVSSNDQYPKQICNKCLKELTQAYGFWQKCRRSVDKLNEMLFSRKNDGPLNKYNVTINNANNKSDDEISKKLKYIEQLKLQLKELDELESMKKTLEELKCKRNSLSANVLENVNKAPDCQAIKEDDVSRDPTPDLSDNDSSSNDQYVPPSAKSRVTRTKKIQQKRGPKTKKKREIKSKKGHTQKIDFGKPNTRIRFTEGGTKYRLTVLKSKSRSSFLCPECGRVVVGSTGFQAHMASHSEVRPYTCDQCDKKYKSYSALKVHLRNHTGERKYHCQQCEAKFITWNSLSSHIKTHHSDARPFVCDICSTSFKYSGSLIVHKRQHTGEKPYACTECTWAFASPGSLRSHMTKHTGERKFPCPVCDKRFRKPYAVKVHMVTHTGERKHKCELCGKAFTQAHVLRSHMKTHQDHIPPDSILPA